jgi:hypothetical protein
MKEILRVEVSDIEVKGKLLIGDLFFDPWGIFIDDYVFRDGDTVVIDKNGAYIDMEEEYLIDLAYGI